MAYTVFKSVSAQVSGVSLTSFSLKDVREVNEITKEHNWVSSGDVFKDLILFLEEQDLSWELSSTVSVFSSFLNSSVYKLTGSYSVVGSGDGGSADSNELVVFEIVNARSGSEYLFIPFNLISHVPDSVLHSKVTKHDNDITFKDLVDFSNSIREIETVSMNTFVLSSLFCPVRDIVEFGSDIVEVITRYERGA